MDNDELDRLQAEHEEWFQQHRAEWRANRPPPVAAWDANNLYRMIGEWNRNFLDHIRPLATAWWAERGYAMDWSGKCPTISKAA